MAGMSREEFEELLYYVVELKDKLNAKLDEQCGKINQQGSIINQHGQIVDELCWQLRELSEKVRDVRLENRKLKEQLGQLCPKCRNCHCDSEVYENHVADKYHEIVKDSSTIDRKISKLDAKVNQRLGGGGTESSTNDSSKTVIYTEVQKKADVTESPAEKTRPATATTPSKKKWFFGGSLDRKSAKTDESHKTTTSNTIWYLDQETIYEPIELSAKPSTRAQLEKISAEVSSSTKIPPKPAPRRFVFPSPPPINDLVEYFQPMDCISRATSSDDEYDVPLRIRPFRTLGDLNGHRGSSKDVDLSYLPEEETISTENVVHFTISSRPATALPYQRRPDETGSSGTDTRRHAIRSIV
ncbi:uncharacterized protein LOC129739385 isoform X2 [Uranotaenia lowii]|uniref:uncharacterized protein LOC129739385 isoform X2 n=1 Tax=Uranotaenia lowii TaxID=190385 RepID=UPI0024792512|nr:uncharacterized protein LOC129739385 isoform X2 [Uranotaenia lowii]